MFPDRLLPPSLRRPIVIPLLHSVQLPSEGADFFSFDPVLGVEPNRDWRRWAADSTIRTLLAVLSEYRAAHPGAPPSRDR